MNTVKFSRNLNLLDETDLSTSYEELVKSAYILPVNSEDEFNKLINYGREFFPDSAFSISEFVQGLDVSITDLKRFRRSYNFTGDLLPVMCLLHTQKGNDGFIKKVKTNLANPSQFDDTVFELKCLYHFGINGFSFYYEPDIYDFGRHSNPDFLLTDGDTSLYCECKQLHMGEGKAELKFKEQSDYLQKGITDDIKLELFNKNLRLEVNFIGSPSIVALDGLTRQVKLLTERDEGMSELPLTAGKDGLEYAIISQDKASLFQLKTIASGYMRLTAGKPRRLANPDTKSANGEIAIFSRDLSNKQAKTLRKAIREAKSQLPNGKPGMILMNRAKLSIAQDEIEKRMNGTKFDDIVAITVNPFSDFWTCYRIQYQELLAKLFDGFQPTNPLITKDLDNSSTPSVR